MTRRVEHRRSPAQRAPRKDDPLQPKRVDCRFQVGVHVGVGIGAGGGMAAVAVAAHVEGQHVEAVTEVAGHAVEGVGAGCEAVGAEDDRRAVEGCAPVQVVQPHPVDLNRAALANRGRCCA